MNIFTIFPGEQWASLRVRNEQSFFEKKQKQNEADDDRVELLFLVLTKLVEAALA